jgi:hypothetical protein
MGWVNCEVTAKLLTWGSDYTSQARCHTAASSTHLSQSLPSIEWYQAG